MICHHGEWDSTCPECQSESPQNGHLPRARATSSYLSTREDQVQVQGQKQVQDQEKDQNPVGSSPLARFRISGNKITERVEAEEWAWPIPSLLPPGLTLFSAEPKAGKTNLALQLAWGVATGQDALGGALCHEGDVLFLAAESSLYDLQLRKADMFPVEDWPDRLAIISGQQLMEYGDGSLHPLFEDWRLSSQRPVLIVMDTLRVLIDMRYTKQRRGGQTDDYAMLRPFWQYAQDIPISILVVHHTSQRTLENGEHWSHKMAGTNGLQGAADSRMLLENLRDGSVLRLEGRFCEDSSYSLVRFGRTWQVFDPVEVVDRLGGRMKDILRLVASLGGQAALADIIKKSPLTEATTRTYVKRLTNKGLLVRLERGEYVLRALLDQAAGIAEVEENE